MKQLFSKLGAAAIAALLFIPVVNAQDEKVKEERKETPKDVERIIVTRKGDNKEKVTIIVDGDNITVNGKPISELKDGDISVSKSKYKTGSNMLTRTAPGMAWSDDAKGWNVFSADENRAMLGVVTEKTDGGVKISDVTKESAAEKAGLKEGDVITKIGDKKIETSDDLSKEIKSHKPGEKVSVTYLRDKKENKATAELTKSKSLTGYAFGEGQHYDFKMPEMNFKQFEMPNDMSRSLPRARHYGDMLNIYGGGQPKLGLSVQDTDDGKGVKVLEVDEESNAAKAGVKENDIVTHVNDKEVNSADEVAKLVKENKDKPSMQLKIKRDGKSQNIEVKMPRKLKTADL